ncbi:MAG: DUF721 domain-containing protein [Dongiaceae bacterium]
MTKPDTKDETVRHGAMLSLAATLPRVTRKTLGRHGLAEAGLVADWASIVGAEIAERSLPLRLAFSASDRRNGTLHVRISGSLAIELQHLEPVIIERINGYFGYRAVTRLKIQQGPVPRPAAAPPRNNPVSPEIEASVGAQVAAIDDDALRQALAGFGRALNSRAAKPRSS